MKYTTLLAVLTFASVAMTACSAQDAPPEERVEQSSEALKRVSTKPPAGCVGTYQGTCSCHGQDPFGPDVGSYYCTIDQAKCGDFFTCWCSCPTAQ